VDFSNLFVNLGDGTYATLKEATDAGAPILKYGLFANTILDFVILAFIIFLMVRAMNRMREVPPPAAPPGPTPDQQLLTEIRDLLKSR
jgi:large conductance mechanosensitive channel